MGTLRVSTPAMADVFLQLMTELEKQDVGVQGVEVTITTKAKQFDPVYLGTLFGSIKVYQKEV